MSNGSPTLKTHYSTIRLTYIGISNSADPNLMEPIKLVVKCVYRDFYG